jgi:hypothetical protein
MGCTPEAENMLKREGAESRVFIDGFVIIPQYKLVTVHRAYSAPRRVRIRDINLRPSRVLHHRLVIRASHRKAR